MRKEFGILLLALAFTPVGAFAQSETKPSVETTEPKSAPSDIRPVAGPAETTVPPAKAGSFQGFGLLQNGNAMLGIQTRK